MGAWGEKPYENDTALDWLGDATKPVVKKALKRGTNDQARAAAQFMIDMSSKYGIYIDPKLAELAIARLEKILAHETWVSLWQDPNAIKRSLKSQIKKLQELEDEFD